MSLQHEDRRQNTYSNIPAQVPDWVKLSIPIFYAGLVSAITFAFSVSRDIVTIQSQVSEILIQREKSESKLDKQLEALSGKIGSLEDTILNIMAKKK